MVWEGPAIGGHEANKGQEKRFENERIAQVQDLQIATYGKYLGAANAYFLRRAIAEDIFPESADPETVVHFLESQLQELLTAETSVDLLASDDVRNAAHAMTNTLLDADEPPDARARAPEP